MKRISLTVFILLGTVALTSYAQRSYDSKKQGFSMQVQHNNNGAFGRIAYQFPPFPYPPAPESIGVAYPIGFVEHVFGGGFWLAGKLDTARIGTTPQRKLVSLCYEGWAGPYYEFFPGTNPADTIWIANRSMSSPPPGWYEYWGSSLPFNPISDQDMYCTYTDTAVRVTDHVPQRLKVIQSSFAWNIPDGEAIHVIEYRIINMGIKTIDSAYAGVFCEGGIFFPNSPPGPNNNYAGYLSDIHAAYYNNTIDSGATPLGIRILTSSLPLDSLQFNFSWYPGSASPPTDEGRYQLMAYAGIEPDQLVPGSSQILTSAGPFTLRPSSGPNPDTLKFVVAIVSGTSLSDMVARSETALQLYLNPPVSVREGQDDVPQTSELYQNYPNPFNPKTKIGFRVSGSGDTYVSLKVFDVLGQEVATLVSEQMMPGSYERTFEGNGLGSGVYFYRLQAGAFTETRKLLLLR